jgi:phenylalanine-4-hydroxylase
VPFDLERVLRSPYRSDAFQARYFVVDDFREVIDRVSNTQLAPLYEKLDEEEDDRPAGLTPNVHELELALDASQLDLLRPD